MALFSILILNSGFSVSLHNVYLSYGSTLAARC